MDATLPTNSRATTFDIRWGDEREEVGEFRLVGEADGVEMIAEDTGEKAVGLLESNGRGAGLVCLTEIIFFGVVIT